MSLQTSGISFPSLSHYVITPGTNYHYASAPITNKLDPITEQIIKKDSALEVIKLIESGAASQLWEAQKAQPSVTWVGNLVDRIFGWGNYYLETQKTAKVIFEPGQKRKWDPCYIKDDIFSNYLYTSFETKIYPNHSCALLDTVSYWAQVFQVTAKPISVDDVICRIAGCIRERLLACYPNCLPCQNASIAEKNDTINRITNLFFFNSDFDEDLSWVYGIQSTYQSNYSSLNSWKLKQIHTLFNTTRKECENQVLHPKEYNGLYALLIIPITVFGSLIFFTYKRMKKKEEYAPLKQVADNL